jgi:hypothetical protein
MNFAPVGAPAYFQVWNFTHDDKLQIETARDL